MVKMLQSWIFLCCFQHCLIQMLQTVSYKKRILPLSEVLTLEKRKLRIWQNRQRNRQNQTSGWSIGRGELLHLKCSVIKCKRKQYPLSIVKSIMQYHSNINIPALQWGPLPCLLLPLPHLCLLLICFVPLLIYIHYHCLIICFPLSIIYILVQIHVF